MPRRESPEDWPDIAVAFGQRIRELRLDRQMSQEELAHAAQISRNQVQNIENSRNNSRDDHGQRAPGPGNPRLDTVWRLARALDVEFVDLLPERLRGNG